MSLWQQLTKTDPQSRVNAYAELRFRGDKRHEELLVECLKDENCHQWLADLASVQFSVLNQLLDYAGIRVYPYLLNNLQQLKSYEMREPKLFEAYEPLLERLYDQDAFALWCLAQLTKARALTVPLDPYREFKRGVVVDLLAKQGARGALLVLYMAQDTASKKDECASIFGDVVRRAIATKRMVNVNPPSLIATLQTEFVTLAGGSWKYLSLFEALPQDKRNLLEELVYAEGDES